MIKHKNEWFYFILICVLGLTVTFVKFANSGSIAQTHLQQLARKIDVPLNIGPFEGYLSLVFSLGQLIGGLLAGLYLMRKIGKFWTFSIGMGVWVVYHILALIVLNPYAYFGLHFLNGFSYGIVYNLILGFVLSKVFNTKKQTPMGVYQAILSIGITSSSFFTSWMKALGLSPEKTVDDYLHYAMIVNLVVLGVIALSWTLMIYSIQLEKWEFKQLWWHKKHKHQEIEQ